MARNILSEQRGTVLLELALSCIVLVAFMFAAVETWSLVRDKIHLQRVVRDAAREAVLTGSLDAGREAGRDRARQYFGQRAVDIDLEKHDEGNSHLVIGTATAKHPVFGEMAAEWWGTEVTLTAQAIFGYKDSTA